MIAPIPAVAPSDEGGVVLQSAALGALLGTAIAMWLHERDREADTSRVTAGLTLLGALAGIIIVAFDHLP